MEFTEYCSIMSAGFDARGNIVVTVTNDNLAEARIQHAVTLCKHGDTWIGLNSHKILPYLSAGIVASKSQTSDFTIIGWGGQLLDVIALDTDFSDLTRGEDYSSIIRCARNVGSTAVAAGLHRQVYQQKNGLDWYPIDDGVAIDVEEEMAGFEAIDGVGFDTLFAVGLDGEVWTRQQELWRQIAMPTNIHLHAVLCAPDGMTYIGGRTGTLIAGEGDNWRILEFDSEETIWNLAWFESSLFIFTGDRVHRRLGGKIDLVDEEILSGGGVRSVAIRDGRMWCFGEKYIVSFDGASWTSEDCILAEPVDSEILVFFDDTVREELPEILKDD